VPVAKGRSALSLSPEALDELLIRGLAVLQQLECDVAVEDQIVGQEHVGHATAARQGS
jgi:hypothetical protein